MGCDDAQYLLECAVIDGRWVAVRPSELAAVCLRSAVCALKGDEETLGSESSSCWVQSCLSEELLFSSV